MNVPLSEEQKIRIANSEQIYAIMQQVLLREEFLGRKQEHFWVIGLATSNQLEYIELVGLGRLNAVHVDPLDVFNFAAVKKLKRIILVHNHPSGNLSPSPEDKELTDVLCRGASLLKIEVLDHLIISETAYFSFVDEGLLPTHTTSETLKGLSQPEAES